MIRLSVNLNIEKPRWWYRVFKCQHNVVSVTEGFESRYGAKTSYMYCLKCGRQAGGIENNCDHKADCFGICKGCLIRLSWHYCKHPEWVNEPDTDDYYCENCGEWKDNL